MENKNRISIGIPVFNGSSTIVKTLRSLLEQKNYFDELLIIDDASVDNSKEVIEKFLAGKIDYKLIEHKVNRGLANTYNEIISTVQNNLIILMHQDVIVLPHALKKLTEPFSQDERIVAASHWSVFSQELWNGCNFWQKCFFARFYKKVTAGLNCQFDCFRKSALEEIGLFEDKAGEDGEIIYKLKKIGLIAPTDAEIVHLQNLRADFGPKDIIYKQRLHAEARGALLRRGRIKGFGEIIKVFFREIIVITLFIPLANAISLLLLIIYSFLYTKQVYIEEYKNPKIIILPFWNAYLLFVSFYFSLKGFISGRYSL